MNKPLMAPMSCFLAGAWAFVLGTLCRWRVLPFLHADTIISGGREVPTAEAALFFSKFFYIGGAVTIALGLIVLLTLSDAQRRYISQLPPWKRFFIWPFRTDNPPKV